MIAVIFVVSNALIKDMEEDGSMGTHRKVDPYTPVDCCSAQAEASSGAV